MSLRRRIQMYASPGGEPVANVWAHVEEDGDATRVTLSRDYPDCTPRPGWMVALWESLYEVVSVEERTLHCRRVA